LLLSLFCYVLQKSTTKSATIKSSRQTSTFLLIIIKKSSNNHKKIAEKSKYEDEKIIFVFVCYLTPLS